MHHKAKYADDAIKSAVTLSSRYLTSRYLPDKAIDIMDEAGSKARIAAMTRPPELKDIEAEIEAIRVEKEGSIKEQDFEQAAHLRDREKNAKKRYEDVLEHWRNHSQERIVDVSEDDIMAVVSKWTGVPLQRMEQAEAQKLLKMGDELKGKVIGQDEAVIAISKALRRSRADLKDPRRPIGSFLFLGPTGVGKTFLAKNLAEFMFGTADSLIQIDMSEYMEKHTASRLIGAPPGYVGYEEGGQLSEAVRRKPYSVVLFDEVEKAHPDVMHLLLQILEEGQVTDNFGRKIDFRNTIIILTSNVGAEQIKRQTSLGFIAMQQDSADNDGIKGKINEAAKKYFKPEFLNRLDELVVFRMLEKPELSKIVDLEVSKVTKRLQGKNIALSLDETARDFLIKEGYDPQYGARPMRRAVEKHIEDPLSEHLLREDIREGDKVTITFDPELKRLKFSAAERSPDPEEAAVDALLEKVSKDTN
jgi:ATP-dependent Clp protease ATP-binding subunit ClpC